MLSKGSMTSTQNVHVLKLFRPISVTHTKKAEMVVQYLKGDFYYVYYGQFVDWFITLHLNYYRIPRYVGNNESKF